MNSATLAPPARTWSLHGPRTATPALPAPPRSSGRVAVENVLRGATAANPLSVAQVAERTALAVSLVRSAINKLVSLGLIGNVTPHQLPAQYAWARCRGEPARNSTPRARPGASARLHAGLYDGKELRPFTGRPGAMVAFTLPSLVDGQRVPRKVPMLIGGNPQERR